MDQNDAQLEPGGKPENENNENHDMASLLAQEGPGIEFPNQGEIRTGTIASITQGQILVSIGTKSEGIIAGREYEAIPDAELAKLEVGQQIPVYVINPEDSNGNLVLSFMQAREETDWQEAEELLRTRAPFESSIVGYNKGGIIVPVGGVRGFVPASQVSLTRRAGSTGETPEQRWAAMVGQPITVCVIEVDRERRRLILSERAASSETRESIKDRILDDLHEGDIRTGRVTSLADFGAFVNINGADGLVHLSEISWDRIQHPSEVLKVGQEVKVKIISVDREKKRIGLSIRQLQDDPWNDHVSTYHVGQLVEGTITRLAKFGAFARLEDDVEGLIHISEISEKRIEHPREVLREGENVTLRIIKIDPSNHRIGLSIRKVESMAFADMDWQTLLEEEVVQPEVEEPTLGEIVSVVEEKPETKKVKPVKAKPAEEAPAAADVPPAVEEKPEPKKAKAAKAKPAPEGDVAVLDEGAPAAE